VFIEAIGRAFAGRSQVDDFSSAATTSIPNWVAGNAIHPLELKRFSNTPGWGAAKLLNAACHTLVVGWLDEASVGNDDFIRWFGETWTSVDRSNGKHGVLLAAPDERLRDEFLNRGRALHFASLANCQIVSWEQLGERAARPAAVSLLALEKSRTLLCRGLKRPDRKLRLFISHAKHDGLSLAQALTRAVQSIPALESFYDARDIEPGSNWQSELQEGVETSVMIAVRTDEYDERPWCVQEVAWAERAGAPITVVDARSNLFCPPSVLPLAGAPWVRIPDGSLTRILYCALRENLRLLVVQRGVFQLGARFSKAIAVLPRAPTLDSLDGALGRLSKSKAKARFVVYPDPKLPPNVNEAVEGFAASRSKKTRVLNYTSLLAQSGGGP
jgi:hypothetical protein